MRLILYRSQMAGPFSLLDGKNVIQKLLLYLVKVINFFCNVEENYICWNAHSFPKWCILCLEEV